MATLTVGLTGGLASGKSTVARQLARAGFAVYDADRIVASLYEPGAPGARAVESIFGGDALTDEGGVDKQAVADRVFRDPALLARLEAAIHPLVSHRFHDLAQATPGVAILEATKLVEGGLAGEFDVVVTVEAPEEVRRIRAQRRGLSADEVERRMAAQATEATRRGAAEIVVENAGDLAALRRSVRRLAATLRRRAAQHPPA